jgi:23S rRNA (guanosine2251-2'-O)-methyltransferase
MSRRTIAGFHAVTARLRHDPASIEVVYVDPSRQDARMNRLKAQAAQAGARVLAAVPARLQQLAGGATHQGVVAVFRPGPAAVTLDDLVAGVRADTLLLVLDGVTDPRNLGACLRTADAAGVQAVVVPRDRAAGMSPVVASAAAGAADTVPLVPVTNLARAMDALRQAGIWLAGAAGEAQATLYELDLARPLAWVLGAEGQGLRRLTRDRCDWLARIPMRGTVASLNVSVAAGICLFEAQRQRALRGGGGASPATAARG